VHGDFSVGVKLLGHEADCAPQLIAKVENEWRSIATLPYVFMAWCLYKHKEKFVSIFLY
jgi:hypothetical protein